MTNIVLVVFAIWLMILTVLLLKTLSNFNKLTKGISQKTLSEVLKNLLQKYELTKKENNKIAGELKKMKIESLGFIQKIGLTRFNPFSDTGGDQSFVLALLDGNNTGFMITCLYARTGMRWYVKTVNLGKGIEHGLSKEETEALKIAQKTKKKSSS